MLPPSYLLHAGQSTGKRMQGIQWNPTLLDILTYRLTLPCVRVYGSIAVCEYILENFPLFDQAFVFWPQRALH